MTASAKLSAKFQISIPKAIRDSQHWSAGQEFVFLPKGSGVLPADFKFDRQEANER